MGSRFAVLAACVAFVACASAPEPTTTKRKKKRKKDRIELKEKKKKKLADDEDVVVVDDEDDDGSKKKRKKDDDDSGSAFKSKQKIRGEPEDVDDVADKPKKKNGNGDDKKKKKKNDEDVEEVASKSKKKKGGDDDVEEVASKSKKKKDDDDVEETASKSKKKKGDEDVEEVSAKKKKKGDEDSEEFGATSKKRKGDEEVEEVATKSKKKKGDEDVEEVSAKKKKKGDEEDIDAEEVAAKPKKKKDEQVVAARAKKKAPVEEEPIDIEIDEPAPKSKTRAKKKDEPEGPVIDMDTEEEEPETRAAAIPVPGVGEDDPIAESDAVSASIEAQKGKIPLAINDRNLTLLDGKLEVHGGLRVSTIALPGAMMGETVSSTSQALAMGVTYGAGDRAEVGADYQVSINPGSAKGPFVLRGAYQFTRGPRFDFAVATALVVDFTGLVDPTTGMTSAQTNLSLQLGAWARIRVNKKASLFTGLPATPSTAAGLSKLSFPLPPFGYQLALGINNSGTVALELPVGLGYQASPKLYAFGTLNLAHVRIANTANAFVFRDFFQLALGGFYALDKIDIGAVLADDFKQGFDYLRFDLLMRYTVK